MNYFSEWNRTWFPLYLSPISTFICCVGISLFAYSTPLGTRMPINQSMFPFYSNYLSADFSSWFIIIFVASPHYDSTAIYTGSEYKYFKIESPICVLIFLTLTPLLISDVPGHDTKSSDYFCNWSIKVAFQASEPIFLFTKINMSFPSDIFWCRISYLIGYFPGPHDNLPLRLRNPFSSNIPIMDWNRLLCEFTPTIILTCPGVVFGLMTSNTLKNHQRIDLPYLNSPIYLVGILWEYRLIFCTQCLKPVYRILDYCFIWLFNCWNLPMYSCYRVNIPCWIPSQNSVGV